MLTLSPDQQSALDIILTWWNEPNRQSYLTLGGYAGTGKSTLISVLRRELHRKNQELKVAFVSYTGKATRVLQSKIKETKATFPQDSISTIHSLIYSPRGGSGGEITGWDLRPQIKYDLVVVDEASMVDQRIWYDLMSFRVPLLAVGDHGQLPPIAGAFNLMEKPMIRLEKIHRQAEGNPIIHLSLLARQEGKIPPGKHGEGVVKLLKEDYESQEKVESLLNQYDNDTLVLCGYNNTRLKLNNFVRGARGFETPDPEVNDRVICLRNNHRRGIFNGQLGTLTDIYPQDETWYAAEIEMDDEERAYEGLIHRGQFGNNGTVVFSDKKQAMVGDLFDFGYALTVHKAQGSQARRVLLFEERFKQMDDLTWRRWLYTAVTRAEQELWIIGD